MQKNCSTSCCLTGQLIEVDDQNDGAKSGDLCDIKMNIFNDDTTQPPKDELQELILDDINCNNWPDVKVRSIG